MDGEGRRASFVSPKEAQRRLGVTAKTLHNWAEAGKIQCVRGPSYVRFYDLSSIQGGLGALHTLSASSRIDVIYARVSSAKQQQDLDRQIEDLRAKFPGHQLI